MVVCRCRPPRATAVAALVVVWAFCAWPAAGAGLDAADHPENVWVKQSPREGAPVPQVGWEGSGAYAPHGRKWIHFGGHDGIPQGCHLFLWDLASGVWRQQFPNTAPPGVCCVDGSDVFDVANRRFVAFPGASLGHAYQWSRGVRLKGSNVWLYDPDTNSWTDMRPPPYKAPEKYSREVIGGICSGATYDPVRGLTTAFGGTGAGGAGNALFVYDAYANQLEQMQAANRPPSRDGMGLAYDAAHDCLVMFGSQYLSDGKTWIYRFGTNAWEAHDLNPHPPAAKGETYSTIPRMAYDAINEIILCVVWLGETGGHQTWAFDAGSMRWTALNPAVEPDPSKSRSRNLAFSPEHNLFILESMAVDAGLQLWTYRYRKASGRGPAAPTALEVATDSDRATLSWQRSSSAGVKAYNVYRAQAARPWQAAFTRIGTTTGTTFEDVGLAAGQVYFYKAMAVGPDGTEGPASFTARTQPRAVIEPVVSVLAADRVEVTWDPHPARDVVGYNVYRGVASVATVTKGTPSAWQDNDPEYPEPVVVRVTDITAVRRLNREPLADAAFVDTEVDLGKAGPESGDYRCAVYAYVVHAVNRLGTESGPSPYALTIAAEPQNVLLRERDGTAELRWDRSTERGVVGYRVYTLGKSHWEIVRLTDDPVTTTTFSHEPTRDPTRYWVVPVDVLGQEGQPSSPVWYGRRYTGFFEGDWHQ